MYGGILRGSTMESVADVSVNMTEGHFLALMHALGYVINEHCGHLPIESFLGVARTWLQCNINRPSHPVAPSEHYGEGGCRMIDLGTRSGFVNRRLHDIVTMLANARELGATYVYWG